MTEKKLCIKRISAVLLLSLAFAMAGIVILALIRYCGVKIPCPFNLLTGLDCPGCGNTRAVIAILNFNFTEAFSLNPLFFWEIFYIAWVYCATSFNYIKTGIFSYGKKLRVIDIITFIVILGWWILRNL